MARYTEDEVRRYIEAAKPRFVLEQGSEFIDIMRRVSADTQEKMARVNTGFHEMDELAQMMSDVIGEPIPEGFRMFTPLHLDFGRNLHIGRDVFINAGCSFQDQGGIWIGDGTLIGHNVVIATLGHLLEPERRRDSIHHPIHIGKNVWIGSNATITGGVTIGDNAAVAAGAVVIRDVPPNTVVGGVPAKFLKSVYD